MSRASIGAPGSCKSFILIYSCYQSFFFSTNLSWINTFEQKELLTWIPRALLAAPGCSNFLIYIDDLIFNYSTPLWCKSVPMKFSPVDKVHNLAWEIASPEFWPMGIGRKSGSSPLCDFLKHWVERTRESLWFVFPHQRGIEKYTFQALPRIYVHISSKALSSSRSPIRTYFIYSHRSVGESAAPFCW
jgi:hypothetical protein